MATRKKGSRKAAKAADDATKTAETRVGDRAYWLAKAEAFDRSKQPIRAAACRRRAEQAEG